jgi:predicted outer membrane protein
VRQAGLWEIPTGQQAQELASSQRVKEVGLMLAADHTKLDEQVRAVAAKLRVRLPSTPTTDQQGWMAELSQLSGEEYDRVFADRLRAAHGKVFSVVALVRAGTKNDEIRAFAQVAIDAVMKHMTLLESTGKVDYAALPTPPPPSTVPSK